MSQIFQPFWKDTVIWRGKLGEDLKQLDDLLPLVHGQRQTGAIGPAELISP